MPGALSIRHNACYVAWEGMWRAEAGMEETPHYGRVVVIVFVDDFDPSTIAALRYARSLRPTSMRAMHFVIESDKAERPRVAWLPDRSVSLEFVDCPNRRLTGASPPAAGGRSGSPRPAGRGRYAEPPAQLTDAQRRRTLGSVNANTLQSFDKHLTEWRAAFTFSLDKP
jgi:hypothetical protein